MRSHQRRFINQRKNMLNKINMAALIAASVLTIGCASQQSAKQSGTSEQAAASKKAEPSTPGARTVKSKDGSFDGEIIGTPAAGSKFSKVKIGMTTHEVNALIGTPDDMDRHETGKRWIPFYFGDDVQRVETLYKGEGCLTYTGGNQFGAGGGQVIRIVVDPTGACING
jgi:hypothetical protein